VNDSLWTWVAGVTNMYLDGIYGEKEIPSADNIPDPRAGGVAWYDSATQTLWLFGGNTNLGAFHA